LANFLTNFEPQTQLMSFTQSTSLTIEQSNTTRIDQVDFDHLTFGTMFTDHMFECDYKDGKWYNPTIKPYGPLTIYPSAKVFHYGQAVFESL
jgi:branched-chain amino acid aminotransferase